MIRPPISSTGFAILCLLVTGPDLPASRQAPSAKAPTALEAYVAHRFDAAMTAVWRMSRDDMRAMRIWLTVNGRAWIAEVPDDRSQRMLAVASFVLEAERMRAEQGDYPVGVPPVILPSKSLEVSPCDGACILEWACTLLTERGAPDAAERTWMLASVAFAGGVRDWGFLHSPLSPPRPRTQITGHVLHAIERFPDESRFRLARAEAIASRVAVLPEMDAPRDGEITGPAPTMALVARGNAMPVIAELRASQVDYARKHLSDLAGDPTVGPEARMRLAYLDFRSGAYATALNQARKAGDAATDPDVRYLARYLAAQAAQALGDLKDAEALLASALEVRPHSQSAAIGLAALKYRRGEAEPAYALIDSTFRERAGDDDPWRMFLYGDYPRMPGLIAELRQQIGGVK